MENINKTCAPSYEISFNETIQRQFKDILDLLKESKPCSKESRYCYKVMGAYEDYHRNGNI